MDMGDDFNRQPDEWVHEMRDRLVANSRDGRGVRLDARETKLVSFALDILGQHFSGAWYPSFAVDGED